MSEPRAVVVGGGICGLVAARVLADHFGRVVLIERDALSDEPGHRRGTPQARHVHGLLARGAQHLEELFPGLRDELRGEGAPLFDHGQKAPTRVWAGAIPPTMSGVYAHSFSRHLLEASLRRRVAALPQVEIRDATQVEGLQLDAAGSRVEGVALHTGETEPEVVRADWVVDASGRFSQLPTWLEKAGYPSPDETVVDADLAYATRLFEAPEQPFCGLQQINRAPDHPRGVYVAGVEHGRWIVTLFGAGGDRPPEDAEGWQEFAHSLGNDHLDALLSAATPVGGVHRFKRTANRRLDYAGLARWPDRLVALGDSVCAFNPVYGQGMTVAVLEAVALGEALRRRRDGDLSGLARSFQRTVARIVRIPWLMSTSEDQIWRHHRLGRRLPVAIRVTNWYKQRLLHLAVHDSEVFRTFLRVYHMVASPAAMGSPRILLKVIFRAQSPS